MVKLSTSDVLSFPSSERLVISVRLHSDSALSARLKSAITLSDKKGDITTSSLKVELAFPFSLQNRISSFI